jgi:hypothetical protein
MGKNNLRLSSGNSITKSRSSQTKRGSGGADHASGDRRRRGRHSVAWHDLMNMGTNRQNDHIQDGEAVSVMTMRQEWMRAGDSTPACWACFVIFDDHVDVLAVIGPTERIDRTMTPDAARTLWADLHARGWYRATEADLNTPDVAPHVAAHGLREEMMNVRKLGTVPRALWGLSGWRGCDRCDGSFPYSSDAFACRHSHDLRRQTPA